MERELMLEKAELEFIEACERGERPNLAEFLKRYPLVSNDLTEFILAFLSIENAANRATVSDLVHVSTVEARKQALEKAMIQLRREHPGQGETLGHVVRRARELQGLTRRDLARQVRRAEEVIQDLESDQLLPTRLPPAAWVEIARILRVTPQVLWDKIVQALQPGATLSPTLALARMDPSAEPEERVAFLSREVSGLQKRQAVLLEEIERALAGEEQQASAP